VPAQQGIRWHDLECWLPETSQSGPSHQAHPVAWGQLGTFDLPLEYDQLLSQEYVLGDQILKLRFRSESASAASLMVVGRPHCLRRFFRLLTKRLMEWTTVLGMLGSAQWDQNFQHDT